MTPTLTVVSLVLPTPYGKKNVFRVIPIVGEAPQKLVLDDGLMFLHEGNKRYVYCGRMDRK